MVVADERLGAFIERYETDNRRRGVRAVVAVVGGVVVTALGVVLVIPVVAPDGSLVPGAGLVPSVVIGCGLGLLLRGTVQGVRALTRSEESFSLHQGGLVHAWSGRTRVVSWDDVAKVVDKGKNSVIARAVGGDVNYVIKLKGGGRVVITGFTDYAERLAGAVETAVVRQERRARRAGAQ